MRRDDDVSKIALACSPEQQAETATASLATLLVVEVLLGLAIAWVGTEWRSPEIVSSRGTILAVLVIGAIASIGLGLAQLRFVALANTPTQLRRARRWQNAQRVGATSMIGLAVLGLISALTSESAHSALKARVLTKDIAKSLNGLNPHIIIGFRDERLINTLITYRAVAGVFITARNVNHVPAAKVAAQIAGWQKTRRSLGLPALIIAADQEGGTVSRLTPPLRRRPSLGKAIADSKDPDTRLSVARSYGEAQGRELASLGINLNLAPVIDLNFHKRNRGDAHTRIFERAISRDPAIVTAVAGAYCDGLAKAGVNCTLKHFPGLGRVDGDTHVAKAQLKTSHSELDALDLAPFRSLSSSGTRMMMLSHVHFNAIDPTLPASLSGKVVDGLIRTTWGFTGPLITDDLTMRAAFTGLASRRAGLWRVGDAAVASLNAGVDLLLISYDTEQVYPVLQALADAYGNGTLGRDHLAASDTRITALMGRMGLTNPIEAAK